MHQTVKNLTYIQSEIQSKISEMNINNYNPKVVAISKTFKIDHILPLIDYGHTDFGENKVQEALEKWKQVKDIRKVITGALEVKRADKTIGSSLESHVDIYLSKEINSIISNIDMAEIAITSSATIIVGDNHVSGFSLEDIKDVVVDVKKAKGTKCKRCWKFDSEINSSDICKRCSVVIQK